MAEEKETESISFWESFWRHPDPFVEVVWGAFFLFIILFLINGLILLFLSHVIYIENILKAIWLFIISSKWIIITISIILSFILVYLIVRTWMKLNKLRENARKLLYPGNFQATSVINPEWQIVLNHIESQNENDWRAAIIQADIMLNDLLNKLSLPGETIGDKLKAVEKSDFTTVDNAWEAHKIRNRIAHDGTAFLLTQREARRVIDLYQSVFEEFKII